MTTGDHDDPGGIYVLSLEVDPSPGLGTDINTI